jgi:hypothetical protein
MIEPLGILIVIVGVAWLIDRGRAAFRSPTPAVRPDQQPAPAAEKIPEPSQSKHSGIRSDWLRLERRSK